MVCYMCVLIIKKHEVKERIYINQDRTCMQNISKTKTIGNSIPMYDVYCMCVYCICIYNHDPSMAGRE